MELALLRDALCVVEWGKKLDKRILKLIDGFVDSKNYHVDLIDLQEKHDSFINIVRYLSNANLGSIFSRVV